MVDISVVVPAYRSESMLPELVQRIHAALDPAHSHEVIVVDDASPDALWTVLRAMREDDARLIILRHGRNAGQHAAILTGMQRARGQVVVTIDDDLQNPPEEIAALVAPIRSGTADLVVAAYDHEEQSRARNLAGGLVDATLRRLYRLPAGFQLNSFRAVRKDVVDAVLSDTAPHPYVTALLLQAAAHPANVTTHHGPRTVGESTYTFTRSLRLLANLLLHYSNLPLFALAALTGVWAVVMLGVGIYAFSVAITTEHSVPGWASVVVLVSFANTISMLTLLLLGTYLSRIDRSVHNVGSRARVVEER